MPLVYHIHLYTYITLIYILVHTISMTGYKPNLSAMDALAEMQRISTIAGKSLKDTASEMGFDCPYSWQQALLNKESKPHWEFYRYSMTEHEAELTARSALRDNNIIDSKIDWAGSCGGYIIYVVYRG